MLAGNFIGSLEYTLLLLSLIPTFIYLVFIYVTFSRERNWDKHLVKRFLTMLLIGTPVIFLISLLFFIFVSFYLVFLPKEVINIGDQIQKYYPNDRVKYMVVAVYFTLSLG
jgi:hypothetical protein